MPNPTPLYRLRGRIDSLDRTFLLNLGENRIGSSQGNDLLIAVVGVSRHHALVTVGGEGSLELEDLASRNRTFVNGLQVERALLHPGDVIEFGPVRLCLEEVDVGDTELGLVVDQIGDVDTPPIDHSTPSLPRSEPSDDRDPLAVLVCPAGHVPGRSPAMLRFYESLRPVLAADLPVLIEGETGVGKESVAKMLHLSSKRSAGPFVAVNCAAIPTELIEAEMFGIGAGVATGVHQRQGRFREAEGGTLFLDEVSEIPLVLQAKLLRALQEKQIQPVGARPIPTDVWVLAATNIDLLQHVADKRFRPDLYYRVAGFVLRIPPLREREGDIARLIEYSLRRFTAETGKPIRGVTVNALQLLERHPWPGNVRELEHVVRRLAHQCENGQAIESSMVAQGLGSHCTALERPVEAGAWTAETDRVAKPHRLADHVREAERRAIQQALKEAAGSQRRAASLLGISRNTLAKKIQLLGIQISSR